MAVKCSLCLLALVVVSDWTEASRSSVQGGRRSIGFFSDTQQDVKRVRSLLNVEEGEGRMAVAEQLEKANKNLTKSHGAAADPSSTLDDATENMAQDDGVQIKGDIAVYRLPTLKTAHPCVLRGCMWPKASDGKVYIPYVISDQYTSQELNLIKRAIDSFANSTCISFIPRVDQSDFFYIQSLSGCYSYVGRQGNVQTVSLSREGCIYYGIIQHELLHVLGFDHEHCRSDRDQHIRVLLQNILPGKGHNFRKVNTLNQGTPYDYGSVMHYGRQAFSKDDNPTMVAFPSPNTVFGEAKQMDKSDINRIRLLYCKDE